MGYEFCQAQILSNLFEQKLHCHLRNKYLLNKIDKTEAAVL